MYIYFLKLMFIADIFLVKNFEFVTTYCSLVKKLYCLKYFIWKVGKNNEI